MSKHVEFPELTPEVMAACDAACVAGGWPGKMVDYPGDRRAFAAFLREALVQAGVFSAIEWSNGSIIGKLFAIANNLHSPPPPPPTLAEAREADLETQEGIETVRAFLASLGEGEQP
jgi:hypothetical protein